ncbi:MAG TPA: ECF-type sigma factor [Bryobacteraceae bacterium]
MAATIPELLERLRAGDESALGHLIQALYSELHRIAAGKLRAERPGHTLQSTALVNEVYLKLMGEDPRHYADRGHFLSVASRVMRQVLVDYARARAAQKRTPDNPANLPPVEWLTSVDVEGRSGIGQMELLDLDRALDELAHEDQMLADLIEMRYFGGMTAEETAEVLGKSVHIVRHDLRLAQAWLRRKLGR